MKGIGISPGLVLGKAFVYKEESLFKRYYVKCQREEVDRLKVALDQAKKEIELIYNESKTLVGEDADIFIAHKEMLEDPELINGIIDIIINEGINSEWAIHKVINNFISLFKLRNNEYIDAKIIDLKDISSRLIRILAGSKLAAPLEWEGELIIIAKELTPSNILQMDKRVRGIVTEFGGITSHTSILSKASNIPMVIGVNNITELVVDGDFIILDAYEGRIILNPCEDAIKEYQERRRQRIKFWELHRVRDRETITQDGYRVKVTGNIAGVEDIKNLLAVGAEGVGLFRTENLFLEGLLDEEEQFQLYKRAVDLLGNHQLTIRTLDVGGDKAIPYLNLPKENNPFLGLRGIRVSLLREELFKIQLRAIYRASIYGSLRLMFPMISRIEEIRAAKALIAQVQEELMKEGIPFEPVEIGMMVETPAAAIHSAAFAREVDFFSIGTNDLIQYTLAVDRDNKNVMELYDPYHPAVLRLIKLVIDNGCRAGIKVSMCGELASNSKLIPLFLAMGLDEFSMDHNLILNSKYIISRSNRGELEEQVDLILNLSTSCEVEKYLDNLITNILN